MTESTQLIAPTPSTPLASAEVQPALATALPDPDPQIRPYLTIRPTSGWAALNLGELWHFRDLMFTLASRDIKVRYKQTALGVIWVILQPLMGAGVFSFVFGKVAGLAADAKSYFLLSYVGLLAWNIFNNTLNKTSGSMIGNAHLISKVYFPRLVLPISGSFTTLIDFSVALSMLAILLPMNHIMPGWQILLLPVWILLLMLLSMGIGLFAAALMVSYRDVGYVLPLITQLLMFASPVAYDVKRVPENLRTLYNLNPLSSLIQGFRWSLQNDPPPQGSFLVWSAAVSVIAFFVGAIMFKRMERKFVDVI